MSEQPDDQAEIMRLGELVDSLVAIWDPDGVFEDRGPATTVDFLERALEAWRFHTHQPENLLPVESFAQCKLLIDDRRIYVQAPDRLNNRLGTGTPPIQLQTRLLLFLLLFHRRRYEVLDIIKLFVERVRNDLEFLDFKKTATGVTRCFTNTRFAANTLREYGLLKFTQREAYKTWVLSLPGFLVASRLLDVGIDWSLPPLKRVQNFDLHDEIRSAWTELKGYDDFVDQLRRVCEPNVEVFSTFEDLLKVAFQMLPGYWEVLNDPNLSQKVRREETMRRLKALDEQPRMTEFYVQFSACVNVERLLKDVE
jgi:hypothetical protein